MPLKDEIAKESTKVMPPAAVVMAAWQGLTLQDWVLVLTLAYLVLQIGWLLWRWWRAARDKNWTPTGD